MNLIKKSNKSETISKKVTIGGYEVEITRKSVKNIRLVVYPPDGALRISVPKYVNDETVRNFVLSKSEWIKKHRERILSLHWIAKKEFVSGEYHYFLGKKYILQIFETNKKSTATLAGDTIEMYVKMNFSKERKEKLLMEFYREQLNQIIPVYIEKWLNIMRIELKEWNIKKMKSRWGSCIVRSKKITLNLDLAMKSERCIEYVVVHELSHFFERGHNARFKAYMDRFLPEWRLIKAELNS